MGVKIDTTTKINIDFNPTTIVAEVIQNLWALYSSIEFEIPLDMGLGLSARYVDKPIETAKALMTADIHEKTEKYEPRAKIVNISYEADKESGKLKPIVEVTINGEYEKYTE